MMFSSLSDDTLRWLTDERCLSTEIIKRSGLQEAEHYGKCSIAIPHTPNSWKLRRLGPCKKHEKWQFLPGKMIDAYGMGLWIVEKTEVYLTEGELDCLLLLGCELNAVTPTTGVKSCDTCINTLPLYMESLVLCLDNDDAGREECARIALQELKSLKPVKIRYVTWRGRSEKDVSELALACRREGVDFLGILHSLIEDYPLPTTITAAPDVRSELPAIGVSPKPVEAQTMSTIESVLETTRKVGHIDEHVEVVIAAYLSKELVRKNPIWLLIVGPPSSNKTELVSLLRKISDVIMIDALTSNPFVSGSKETKQEKVFDLLAQLHNSCYIVKEYTSFFSQSEETVKKLLGDMTAIYDGNFAKHSPVRGTITYNASFSHIGCVTPEGLRKRQQYMNMIGPRFLMLRYRALSELDRDVALENAWGEGFEENIVEARRAVQDFIVLLRDNARSNGPRPVVPRDIQARINLLAKFTARTRGIVHTEKDTFKDEEGEEVTHTITADVQIEEPFRALSQFRTLCIGLAIARGKQEVTQAEYATLNRVALDSMPQNRADVLTVFRTLATVTAKEAAIKLERHPKTIRRHLEELVTLGVLQKEKEGDAETQIIAFPAWRYRPVDQFSSIICGNKPSLGVSVPRDTNS